MDKRVEANSGESDLVLTRVIDVPRALVWKAWTVAEHLEKWWSPRPYSVTVLEMDVRPGGAFRSLMHAPDGADMPENNGCYLEVIENERLSFTTALTAGFCPAEEVRPEEEGCSSFPFTAIVTLEALGENSTRYTARALHRNGADRKKHEEMGFHEGWGTCLDQLVAHVKTVMQAV